MTSAAVSAARAQPPRPYAIPGAVENDIATRTLIVKRPRQTVGYAAFSWRQAHEHLKNAEERGWPDITAFRLDRVPTLWGSAPGHRQLVTGTSGPNLELHFHFPAGTEVGKVYTELVSKPGLSALVTVDRGTLYFLGVTFKHRGVAA